MLIEMTVANFRSVKEPQTISFVALNDSRLPVERTYQTSASWKVLKSTAIIGPNGAGKSTFVRALEALKGIITAPSDMENPLARFFAGNFFAYSEVKGSPCEISIKVLLDNVTEDGQPIVAIYTLVADSKQVFQENLTYSFGNTRKMMFDRQVTPSLDEEPVYAYRYGKLYRGEKKKTEKKIPATHSFLAWAAAKGGITCGELYKWFNETLYIMPMGAASASADYLASALEAHPLWVKQLVDFLWSVDITDIRNVVVKDNAVYFIHTNVTQHYSAKFMSESLSLRRLCVIAVSFFEAFTSQRVMLVDDFGMFLHPNVLSHIVKIFEKSSKGRSQLICVDCNPALLEEGLFRRDGIWFAQKDSKGASQFFSLCQFKYSAYKDKARLMYENGSFGALPIVSEFSFSDEEVK
ncbi:MAG: ATP-binding protein [Sphaerochaetaceae bacterium]|jgi:hypothetical protein|nr:ATP-binding protein [Sphaerochaetaceae bacterium]